MRQDVLMAKEYDSFACFCLLSALFFEFFAVFCFVFDLFFA